MSRHKLLLADDSVTIQKVVNLTFADEGIEVFAVGDGIEAIDRLLEISPDLVMADVSMPGINGYQVCERIKQHEKFKNTPVILLVGSFEPFDEQEARRVGADDYLTKPFQSIRQLVNKVSDLLERSEQNAGMSSSAAASSFADTQEMEHPVEPETSQSEAPRYDDAEIDDEMIQTNQASSFAFDESPKFASRNYVEAREENYGKTQPLSAADLRELESPPDEYASPTPEQTYSGETSQPETAAFAEADDDDFLELFDDDEFEDEEEETENIEPQAETTSAGEVSGESQTVVSETAAAQPEEAEYIQPAEMESVQPTEAERTESAEAQSIQPDEAEDKQPIQAESVQSAENEAMAASASSQLSPEMIDAIAQRVIEKLSASAVKEIAWEVVPQQADLIIKKMVEEKLKE